MAGCKLQKDIFEFDDFIRHSAMIIDKMYDFIGTIQLKTQSLAVLFKISFIQPWIKRYPLIFHVQWTWVYKLYVIDEKSDSTDEKVAPKS